MELTGSWLGGEQMVGVKEDDATLDWLGYV